MAKNRNNLPGLSGLKNRQGGSLTGVPGLVDTSTPTGGAIRLGNNAHRPAGGPVAKSIDFGRPPAVHTSSAPGTNWAQLVTQAANSGVASLFGGGLSLTGIGSLVSGVVSLFGGHEKSLPTLTPFQLGPSQNESITIAGGAITASTQSIQDHSAQIAQAVKTAVLNSSSLNDVLSEI